MRVKMVIQPVLSIKQLTNRNTVRLPFLVSRLLADFSHAVK
jgi:hypothetical protein